MRSKRDDTSDQVTLAEQQLAQAQANLDANIKERQERTQAVTRLDEAMGANPDAKDAERMGAQARVHEARLRHLDRERKALEKAVVDAEAGLKRAESERAAQDIRSRDGLLDRLNAEIIEALAVVLVKIDEHEEVVAGRDVLAAQFELPTPARGRFLFPKQQLRSHACDLLRDRLAIEYGLGGVQVAPAP
jgi:small-conductance mechanosensitive channel